MGSCLDAEGDQYDRYYTRAFETYEECEAFCVKNEEFRGINIENDSVCYCLYEEGLLYISELGSPGPFFDVPDTYQGGSSTIGGIGQIVSSDGARNAFCYRYVEQASSSPFITPRVPSRSGFP